MSDQNTLTRQERCKFHFGPEFDKSKMEELERVAQARIRSDGVSRRIALAALTRSSQELLKGLTEPGSIEAVLEVVESLESTIADVKAEIEFMEVARTRLLWAFNEAYGVEICRAAN